MTLVARTLTLALLLWSSALRAQWIHWGLDESIGIHYNTLDAASYKKPFGNAAVGMHITIADPEDFRRVYFNGRLTFGGDIHTATLFQGIKLDCSLLDLAGSFQAHKKLNETLSVYAGVNLFFNVGNIVRFRSYGNIFSTYGQQTEAIEAMIRQKTRKLNAGVEAGFMYPLGKGFTAGLHLSYYVFKRLNDGLELGRLGAPEDVSLNFRPLALKILCALDLY